LIIKSVNRMSVRNRNTTQINSIVHTVIEDGSCVVFLLCLGVVLVSLVDKTSV
jgi:hypothetical protein